jgi:hypothetical protein
MFGLGKVGQWVVLAVNGLRFFAKAQSPAPQPSAELDKLFNLLSQLLADKAAGLSSTPKPGT